MAHAVAAAESVTVSAEELLLMPDDGVRRELVRGEIREMPPTGEEHGEVGAHIITELGTYVRSRGLGRVYAAETGFRIEADPDTVLAPDCSFVSTERIAGKKSRVGFRAGAPDLAVEVLSPGDSFETVEEKVWLWLAAGCRMVIVVNPRRRAATVYRSVSQVRLLSEDDVLDGEDVVPGWTLPLRSIFG